MRKLAPVVVFAYRRPAHLARTLAALAFNREAHATDLIICCDHVPLDADPDAVAKMNLTREIARREYRFQSVRVVERPVNVGLAENVIQGVSEVMKSYGAAIVLEDDLLVTSEFLTFMNEALVRYENNKTVACISGYVYPIHKTPESGFFLRGADCWGWASWDDRWHILEQNPDVLIDAINKKRLQDMFDFDGSYPYLQMLKDRSQGLNNSWAILWYASAFVKEKLCLYPARSFVQNIGNDGSGTNHVTWSDRYDTVLADGEQFIWPDQVAESTEGRELFRKFFTGMKPTVFSRLRKRLGKIRRSLTGRNGNNLWSGDYSSWKEAEGNCTGYDSKVILEQVKQAVKKVIRGEAAFERDGVVFEKFVYSPHLKSVLESIYRANGSPLTVLDFGGSLGSLYFQYRNLLEGKLESWNVVEQDHFVTCGKAEFENEVLKFFYDIGELTASKRPDVLILSSVICYLGNPYEWIRKFIDTGIEHIIIDRTAFIQGKSDRLTIQQVPDAIYPASYPAWFLNEEKFLIAWLSNYDVCRELPDLIDGTNTIDGFTCYRKGYYLTRKK